MSDKAAIAVALVAIIPLLTGQVTSFLQNRQIGRQGHNLEKSVGVPLDGETLHELVSTIKKFEEYQHLRNHDILNSLHAMNLLIPLLIDQLDQPGKKESE